MTINIEILRKIYSMTAPEFETFGVVHEVMGRKHIFQDNGSNVLAIAHLDYVLEDPLVQRVYLPTREILISPKHDDRLGVYLITEMLPLMGILPDVLLTTDEEIGRSTGGDFSPPKQYNWMFMFDRRGSGCVTYMYNNQTWQTALKKSFDVQQGSGSCISHMEHLECSAVNVGTAYHDEHSDMCYVDLGELDRQLSKFKEFWEVNKDVYFQHSKYIAPPRTTPYYSNWRGDDEYFGTCELLATRPIPSTLPEDIDPLDKYLDYEEYWGLGVPVACKFCGCSLIDFPSEFYMGICCNCEDNTIQCADCSEYIIVDLSVYGEENYDPTRPITWVCATCYKATEEEVDDDVPG